MTDKLNNPFKISELVETVNNLVDTTYDDSVVVHKAGTETITGAKTFQNQIITQSTTNTTSGTFVDFIQNINSSRRGTIRTTYNSDGSYQILVGCNGPDGAAPNGITIKRSATEMTITGVTPDTSDNSTKIATTAFVKAQGYITSYTDTKNTAGSTDTSSKIFLIGATSQAANPQTYSQDTVFVNTSGQLQTPTPGNDSNTTVAATTAFVKNVLKTSGAGLYTISKAANGYCKFNGGLIIQWMKFNYSTGDKAFTFPTPFTTTNIGMGYMFIDEARNNTPCIKNISTTGGTFHPNSYSSGGNIWFIAVGY